MFVGFALYLLFAKYAHLCGGVHFICYYARGAYFCRDGVFLFCPSLCACFCGSACLPLRVICAAFVPGGDTDVTERRVARRYFVDSKQCFLLHLYRFTCNDMRGSVVVVGGTSPRAVSLFLPLLFLFCCCLGLVVLLSLVLCCFSFFPLPAGVCVFARTCGGTGPTDRSAKGTKHDQRASVMFSPGPYGAMRPMQYNMQRRAAQQLVAETQRQMMQQGCMVPDEMPQLPEGFDKMGDPNSGWSPCQQQSGSHEPTPAGCFGGFSPPPHLLSNDLEKMRISKERYGKY
ncbi:hypothetical protein MOQ_008329 [Trypanosoma cruzi marinkellei]|uniref:Uncharacterized protein n=1 Tax=Trypanosoma cruzi marinkellei TaxID=85056 RepID=K2LZ19_TRYCR|nr:hypothetical protein MOQ_008329 [Trypanosoma cruzi marinkellei]